VRLALPRFGMERQMDLKGPMKAIGLQILFDPSRADFGSVLPGRGVGVGRLHQRTYLRVDEEGTEAAAVTLGAITLGRTTYESFEANRPFLYAIRERTTGAILLLGAVHDPS
jgi:serine protease inhibitor